MTNLERLIKAHTEATTVATIGSATEKIAEEIARDLLRDPTFRAEMQALVRVHFITTMHGLAKNGRKRKR
jgi:hypothetical protein